MTFEEACVRLVESVTEDLDVYRETQCTKYYAEKGQENRGDYVKLERYKNRVRKVDCILPHLEMLLHDIGIVDFGMHPTSWHEKRTQID